MVVVRVERFIACEPEQVLDLVMDIERYATVDKKIDPVLWWRREGDVVTFACRPKLVGLRQPAVVQNMRLTPGRRVDISLAPPPANRLSRAMADFHASFETTPCPGGTTVIRTLRFEFSPIARRLLEPLFARRLDGEVRDELDRAKALLEAQPQAPV